MIASSIKEVPCSHKHKFCSCAATVFEKDSRARDFARVDRQHHCNVNVQVRVQHRTTVAFASVCDLLTLSHCIARSCCLIVYIKDCTAISKSKISAVAETSEAADT